MAVEAAGLGEVASDHKMDVPFGSCQSRPLA